MTCQSEMTYGPACTWRARGRASWSPWAQTGPASDAVQATATANPANALRTIRAR
jgi:hypothetical protein